MSLLLTLAIAGTIHASAECITMPMTLVERFAGSTAVFIAEVTGIEVVLAPDSYRRRVTFAVSEAFKGVERGEQSLVFRPTAEDYEFSVGERVLVWAGGGTDNYSTNCSRTRRVTINDLEVQQLRDIVRK